MPGQSIVKVVRLAATTLTASYVYNTSTVTNGLNYHSFLVDYVPAENAPANLNMVIQISQDDENTTDANSKWITLGTIAFSTGTGTFTASTLVVTSGGAAGALYAHWDITNTAAYKMRVGVKELNVSSTFGVARITQFSKNSGS